MKTEIVFFLLIIWSVFASAQKTADVTLYFHDGSVLYGSAKLRDINLNTPYGKLSIPLKDVTQIIFGLEKDESISSDIQKNIQILATTSDDKNITAASENIRKYGLKAIYYLESYIDKNPSLNTETLQRLLTDILSENNLTEYSYYDIVELNNGDKFSGNLDFKTVEFFNNFLKSIFSVNTIKSMDVSYYESTNGLYSFSVKASRYIMANNNGGWLNTGIKIKTGQTLEINARGEITLASLDNKKYTPDGYLVGQESSVTENADPNYFNYGTLVFKIGKNGKTLRAGSNTKYIADSEGIVYLSIYETVYSDKNTGSYKVKISVK